MATIKITDESDLETDLSIRPDSSLAKAGLTKVVAQVSAFFDEFSKPVDEAILKSVSLGLTVTSPNLLSDDTSTTTVGGGANCTLTILTSQDGSVFPGDDFSLDIPIEDHHAWVGVQIDVSLKLSGAVSYGVGIAVEGNANLKCSTYTLFAPPLPLLLDACGDAFSNYRMTTGAASIRNQTVGTINVADIAATGKVTLSVEAPITLNALASADMPFVGASSIQPSVTLKAGASIAVTGEFIFRCFKKSDTVVRFGVYKRRGTSLTASLTAGAGVGGDVGTSDVLGAILQAALPNVKVAEVGFSGDRAKTLNGVLKDSIDRTLSAQLNAACAATFTDEAAIVYDVPLVPDDSATDAALLLALRGDWTTLTQLPGVTLVRDIVVKTMERKDTLILNLFGFYSAISVTDYLQSFTVLLAPNGQMSLVDKASVSRIAASTANYAADSEKLRTALMQDFVCTATYAPLAAKLGLQIAVVQTYFQYAVHMSPEEMQQNLLLAYALQAFAPGAMDAALTAARGSADNFGRAAVEATIKYNTEVLLGMFYSDVASRTPRKQVELEVVGRRAMTLFLDPHDRDGAVRLKMLNSAAAWAEMDEEGNSGAFGTLPSFAGLNGPEVASVASDWVTIEWWAKSLANIAPVLSKTLDALEALPPGSVARPMEDPALIKQRAKLAKVLRDMAANTHSAFVDGWGPAVMFALSQSKGAIQMKFTVGDKIYTFPSPPL